MKHRVLSLLVVLALLPTAVAAVEPNVFRSFAVSELLDDVVDWSAPVEVPDGPRVMHRFYFCQAQTGNLGGPWVESCYVAWFARGPADATGYIRFSDADSLEVESGSGPWFSVRPWWNQRLRDYVDYLVFNRRDVNRLMVKVADWSTEFASLEGPHTMHKFLFCQGGVWTAPQFGTDQCVGVWYARGLVGTAGYIRIADEDGEDGTSGPWFRLTPEWNRKFKNRLWYASVR